MFLAEFLRVTSLSISYIDLAGLSIIDDVGPQDSNLRHAFFRRFDLCRQFIMVGCGRCRFSSSTAYSSRLCSVRKFIVCAICLRLKTLAQRAYPAPFPARSFSWMSTSRLTLGGSACTVDFLRGVCCFFPASTARISASLYPVPSPSSIRATFSIREP